MRLIKLLIIFIFLSVHSIHAEFNWASVTFDNDLFTGSDNGYTNGLYISLYEAQLNSNQVQPELLVTPLLFTLDRSSAVGTANLYSFGQTMITPDDISRSDRDENDVPYTGLLFVTNSYITVYDNYADDISTSLGIVGPASGAEKMQRFIHDLTGSDAPQGWASQTNNELVFQFGRGRTYYQPLSDTDTYDVLYRLEARLGTLSSGTSAKISFRYGNNMKDSFSSFALDGNRISNPLAIRRSWYVYFGLSANYLLNSIFLDGNTFEKSASIDYDPFTIGGQVGFAYAWNDLSVTLAIEDRDLLNNSFKTDTEYQRFGTFTIAWQL